MVQIETRIAITFQSTILKASSSVMTPNQIITATPSSAAAVLSIHPAMTTTMVTKKMAIAIQVSASIEAPRLNVAGQDGSRRIVTKCRRKWQTGGARLTAVK